MTDIKSQIKRNETKIEAHNKEIFVKSTRAFTFINNNHYKLEETIGLDVIISGKSLLTTLTSYEQDIKLYNETKNLFKGNESKSLQTSMQTGIILASSNNDNLLNIDARIIASKQILILKVEEYNQKVKIYLQNTPYRWKDNIEFVSL